MTKLSAWLRTNSQHYLLQDSQVRVARRHGIAPPPVTGSWFWTKVFVPVYRAMPWSLRRRVMVAMPGSHRQLWTPDRPPEGPAI